MCAKNITFGILLHALVKMPVILFLNKEENYYFQVKEKIDLKRKNVTRHIADDLEISSDDSDESDEE